MALSDFFVGSRQLFGFLAPGAVWCAAAVLVTTGRDPVALLSTASIIELFLLLALSLLVGTAIETVSFNVGVRTSALLHGQRVSKGDRDYLPSDVGQTVVQHVRKLIAARYPDDPYLRSLDDHTLSQFCRRTLLERSTYFKQRLLEYEAEANLLAMLILPTFVFSVCWIFHVWFYLNDWSICQQLMRAVPVALAGFVLVGLFLMRLHPLRREEAEAWFEMFIITQLTERGPRSGN